MSWIKSGAQCVCVDAYGAPLLEAGKTYTVHSYDGGWLRVAGVYDTGGRIAGWFPSRFRPIISRTQEQDIAMFKRIADTVPSLEDAE